MTQADEWPEVRVVHVFPCGTASLPLPDGSAATVRMCLGHLDAPDTGLLEEVRSRGRPTPWRSEATRDEALAGVEARADLSDDVRARLLRHVRRTPFYVDL